jgi:ABC-2 type transport system permease protein
MNALAIPIAFFIRDYRLAISYRAGFFFEIVGAIVNVFIFYFVSDFFGSALAGDLDGYGDSYFLFVIVGIAFTTYLRVGLSGISTKVRDGQLMGTLELMLISPSRLPATLLSSTLWAHLMASLGVVTYAVFAVVIGPDVASPNLGIALLALMIAIVGFNAMGLLVAASVIVLKQGSPVNWLVNTASVLLAGVFYPTEVLPEALQALGRVLPMTHALEIVRRSLLGGEGIDTLLPSFVALVALTAVYLPLGILACHWAVRVAQTDGSLTAY